MTQIIIGEINMSSLESEIPPYQKQIAFKDMVRYANKYDKNLEEVISLIKKGGVSIEDAFKIITKNPANNLGLTNKGIIKVGADADFCVFDSDLKLMDVLAHGVLMMENYDLKVNDSF